MNNTKSTTRTTPDSAVARVLLACTLSATMVAGGIPVSAFAATENSRGTAATQSATVFSDVPTSGTWYSDYVYAAAEQGIFSGYNDGSFGPNDALTRAQAAVVLWRIIAGGDTTVKETNKTSLTDIADNQWYTAAANWAVSYGIITGFNNRYFAPNQTLTREQLCTIIYRIANKFGTGTLSNSGLSLADMQDADSVSSWAKAATDWCIQHGVINGCTGANGARYADGGSAVSRAMMAKIAVCSKENGVIHAVNADTGWDESDNVDSTPTPEPEPEAEPEAEATPEPEPEAEPEPEPTPEPTPSIIKTDDSIEEEEINPNPEPDATPTITTVADPTVENYLVYDGSEQVGVTCSDPAVTLSGTVSATNAGIYTAYATTDANHTFADGSTYKVINWEISTPSLGSAVTITDGWYTIGYAANTNLCLDMTDGSMDELACTQTYTKNSTDAQKWHIVKNTGNYYTIECGASGMVLGVAGANTANGTRVDQASYKEGDAGQLWSIYQVNGKYVFKNKLSGRVLDVNDGSTKPQATVWVWDWNGTSAQGWTLTKTTEPALKSVSVSSGWYHVVSYVDNEYLDVNGNSSDDGANVQIWGNTGADCQKWYIKNCGSYYTLQSGSSYVANKTEVLDCENGGTTTGTNVQQYTSNGTGAQKWYIKQRTNGAYVFINVASGKRLDVSGAAALGNVQLWDANNSKAQVWSLVSTSAPTVQSSSSHDGMTDEEWSEACQIFDTYNAWRVSKGLSSVNFSMDCCDMAFDEAKKCASTRTLQHGMFTPINDGNDYSDILQYSTWKMTPSEAVTSWANSSGHRKQMQCTSTYWAGVGCYNDNGTWFYVIVYSYSGSNVSGN